MTLWLVRSGTGAMAHGRINCDREPCPAIMAGGLGGGNCSQYWLEDDMSRKGKTVEIDRPSPTVQTHGRPKTHNEMTLPRTFSNGPPTATDKPPYRVPLMSEIVALPWNCFKVASTFSGAGGSCTGYRMAGFKVVWANEFVPAAQASYKANAAADCHLDCRDIKFVQPADIFAATGLKQGELDLFDGSPPCQAFSTAGKREKGWGKAKTYEHGAKQCNETLFSEYIRLLRGLMPRTFVAENVSGLVKGTAKGYFLEILRDLKASGYRVTCKVLDAKWLGVPQSRQRTIFVGVREDLGMDPVHPKPLPYLYSVRDALPWIGKAIHDTGGDKPTRWAANVDITNRPSPAITIGVNSVNSCHYKVEAMSLPPSRLKAGAYGVNEIKPDEPCPTVTIGFPGNDIAVKHGTEKRKFTIAELKRICAFPDDFILCGSYAQQWERLGNSVPPVMMRHIAETIRDKVLRCVVPGS